MVYVYLDWFVYEDIDMLRMLRIHVYRSVHATFEYNNLKSLVRHNRGVARRGYTEEHAVAARDCRTGAGTPENYRHQMYHCKSQFRH